MSGTFKTVVSYLVVVLVLAAMIVLLVVLPDEKQDVTCTELRITIADSTLRHFVTKQDLRQVLVKNDLLPENKIYRDINTQQIEELIRGVEVLSEAECYKLNDGVVCLRVNQRVPKLRVMGSESYYVDENRQLMKATYKTACRVPIVTGYVTHEMAQNELFDFVEWLEGEEFWDAQIEQINVKQNREIELIPRAGNHVILLGNLKDYKNKLKKLHIFYIEVLNLIGWEQEYNELDLRFKGQVVCRKH